MKVESVCSPPQLVRYNSSICESHYEPSPLRFPNKQLKTNHLTPTDKNNPLTVA